MSPLFSFLTASPLHLVGAALSVFAAAIALEGICAKAGWHPSARNHSWDTIAFGIAVSVFMGCAAASGLGQTLG